MQNQAGRKGLKYAASKGLGVIIMEPLRGGLLARKPPSEIDAIWDEAQDKKTPVEWALRWIWNHPEVTVVLSGMNEESQIEDNIRYAQDAEPNSLLTEDLELIKRVSDQFYKMMKVGCTGCHYCMPCPSGVNIPTWVEYYNHMHMYKDVNWAKLSYLARVGGLFSDPSKALLCEKCGECEEKCPQKLPVQDFLEMVSSEMEGPFFNAKVWAFQKFIRFKNGQAIRSISK